MDLVLSIKYGRTIRRNGRGRKRDEARLRYASTTPTSFGKLNEPLARAERLLCKFLFYRFEHEFTAQMNR